MEIGGLHHVTAVTGRPQENVDFYTGVLGMRLVKKTVNQDDVSAYHLFYANEFGSADTEMTFFDWGWAGGDPDGSGKVSATAFRVPGRATLDRWAGHFDDLGVNYGKIEERGVRAVLPFTDPEGQSLELVADAEGGAEPGVPPVDGPVGPEMAVRGLHSVTLTLADVGPTGRMLTGLLGFRRADEYERDGARRTVFEVGPGGPGTEVHVEERPGLSLRRQVGIGGVHHVAFRVPDEEQHALWREKLRGAGVGVTPVIDRFYFRSIYFREPGGVLFEIATDGPGFATDEDIEHLGERLSLPPFLEEQRERIEGGLTPVSKVGVGDSG